MKRLCILFLLAIFSLNLFRQLHNVIVIDSTYSYKWDTVTNDWFLDYQVEC